ncbi:MAG: TlpA family protein disulfide reductase [Bacteroidales bacterium]|nr:TlpA family protein disulfide reductase [Bacteroidales bacterium]
MKSSRIALMGLCALLAAACAKPSARIDGTLTDAPDRQVIVKLLDINNYKVLDSVKTDAAGRYSYKVPVQKGQPEFVYLYYGDTKISSLLLQEGDEVKVVTDTLGRGSVVGSVESERLQEVERKFAEFLREAERAEDNATFRRSYIQYYREAVKYVMNNPHSLTVVPVLFQNVNPDLPVFSQTTDALHFRSALDSLSTVYPDSKYVKALERETTRREGILGFDTRLSMATEAEYPDIKSKDVNGNDVSLQALDSKAIILFFWTVTDPESKILNQETYKPVYQDYHDKGLEIFAVSLDTDKAAWASVVKSQELPWVNVNDGLGASSPAVSLYNVTSLPRAYLILDGKIIDRRVEGEKALRRELDKVLK